MVDMRGIVYWIRLAVLVAMIISCTSEEKKVKTEERSDPEEVKAESVLPGIWDIDVRQLSLPAEDSMGLPRNCPGKFIQVQTREWPYYTMTLLY